MSEHRIAMVGTPCEIMAALLMLNWAYSVWRIFHISTL